MPHTPEAAPMREDVVQVTQADREAAAQMLRAYKGRLSAPDHAESALLAINVENGLCDDSIRVQAFARHRLASARPDAGEDKAEIERLRGLLIDPGSPPWEDARAVLVAELRKAGLDVAAHYVADAQGADIPSHIALNLIAQAARRPDAGDEVERGGYCALLPQVIALVVAARNAVADPVAEALGELDRAVEQFAASVPWDDEPKETLTIDPIWAHYQRANCLCAAAQQHMDYCPKHGCLASDAGDEVERVREAAESLCNGATDDCTNGRQVFVDPEAFDRLSAALDAPPRSTPGAVEAAARAMCDRVNGIGDYDENIDQRRAGWLAQAKAGIDAYLTAAIREGVDRGMAEVPRVPTEAMLKAGADAAFNADSHGDHWIARASAAWTAMLDAAALAIPQVQS